MIDSVVSLSEIMPRKALDPAAFKVILDPVLDTLSSLHKEGIAHGSVKPRNIVQEDGQWKLVSDAGGSAGRIEGERELDTYDAPEVGSGIVTPAADLWSLGIIVVEALAQKTPIWDRDARADLGVPAWAVPEPFLEIARGCLRWKPSERISIGDARALLGASMPASDQRDAIAYHQPDPLPAAIRREEIEPIRGERRADAFREPEEVEFAPRSRLFRDLDTEEEGTGHKFWIVVVILVALAVGGLFALRGYRGRLFSPRETRENAPSQSEPPQPGQQAPQNQAPASQASSAKTDQPQAQDELKSGSKSESAPAAQPAPDGQSSLPTESSPAQGAADSTEARTKEPAESPAASKHAAKQETGETEQASGAKAANSKGAVLNRVLPNILPEATSSMRGPVLVELRVSVNAEGTVSNVEYVTQGPGNYFARKAYQAAEAWRFDPPRSDGRPSASQWVLLFRFHRSGTDVTANIVR